MRHRSKTNSRKHEDKVLREQYRADNPLCELYRFDNIPAKRDGAEINHIFSVRKRFDLLSNLIHLSVEAHRWFHEYPIDGRVMSLFVKLEKGELNNEEIKTASGMYIAGWLSARKPALDWVLPYWKETARHFS